MPMIPSLKKRFWKAATVQPLDAGFTVHLDQRRLTTPLRTAMVLPTRALAAAIAAEWQAQGDKVDPATMPMTRRANAALDKVTPQHAEVAALLAEYGASDLVCYRADHPAELVDRQAQAWDPILTWAETEFGVRLTVTSGIMPVAQTPQNLRVLKENVVGMDPFSLAGFYDLVALSGSLLIAFATIRLLNDPGEMWRISQLDEDWQAELWGLDDEAAKTASRKKGEYLDAFGFYQLVNTLKG